MEKKELDIFMAEKVNKWHKDIDRHTGKWIDENGKDTGYYYKYPRHLTSTMIWWYPTKNHEQTYLCEEMIPEDKREEYINALMDICEVDDDYHGYIERSELFRLIHSTPDQRCQAIYRTYQGE